MSRPLFVLCLFCLFVGVPGLLVLPGLLGESPPAPDLSRAEPAATWSYVVKPNDVLSVIAQRELGTMRRVAEILALNPDVEPRALVVGSVLRMPPREVADPFVPLASPPPAAAPAGPGGGLLKLFLGLLVLVALFVLVGSRFDRGRARAPTA